MKVALYFLFVLMLISGACSSGEIDVPRQEWSHSGQYTELNAPSHLYVLDRADMNYPEYQMVVSLQGLLAQTEPRIYITTEGRGHSYASFLDVMEKEYGVTTEKSPDPLALLDQFKDEVAGYILTKRWDSEDTNAATSLAGIKNCIVVSEVYERHVKGLGLNMVMDARDMNVESVFEAYKEQFNNNLVFTQDYYINELRDYAIATKAFIFHSNNKSFIDKVYEWVADDRPQFGWGGLSYADGGGLSEDHYIGNASKHSVHTNGSNWVNNLSVLASLDKDVLKQKSVSSIDESEDNTHYLSIIMSDGDNYSFVLEGMADDNKYFANPNRGDFPLNWTIPSGMIELAPAAMEWYYTNATVNDYFVAGASGVGYMTPSMYPLLDEHLSAFNEYVKRTDLPYVGFLDWFDIGSPEFYKIAAKYARQSNIKGVVYVDYARSGGHIEFVGGKPFVTMRANLWDLSQRGLENLAKEISNSSRDVNDAGAYSLINVHVWSHDVDDVAYFVSQLDDHVKVVKMDEFFQRISKNIKP